MKNLLSSDLRIRIILDDTPAHPMEINDYVGDFYSWHHSRSILPRRRIASKGCNTYSQNVDIETFWHELLAWPNAEEAAYDFENEDDIQVGEGWAEAKTVWDKCNGDFNDFKAKYTELAEENATATHVVIGFSYSDNGGLSWGSFSDDIAFDGVCVFTPAMIAHELAGDMEMAKKYAEGHLSELSSWANGEVFGFVIEKITTCECCDNITYEDIDSCWGYYGEKWVKEAAKEAAKGFLADDQNVE